MKKILFGLVTILLTALTSQTVNAQDPSIIAKGAGLWASNCTRCHNARSPMERNDRSWVTVVNHMRARANLTKSEARAIAAYLQAVNTPETINTPEKNVTVSKRDGQRKTATKRSSMASVSRRGSR